MTMTKIPKARVVSRQGWRDERREGYNYHFVLQDRHHDNNFVMERSQNIVNVYSYVRRLISQARQKRIIPAGMKTQFPCLSSSLERRHVATKELTYLDSFAQLCSLEKCRSTNQSLNCIQP